MVNGFTRTRLAFSVADSAIALRTRAARATCALATLCRAGLALA